jgi:hypothetical protein
VGRRARYLIAAVFVTGAALPAAAPGTTARKLGCRPAGSKTVVTSARARVFRYHGLVWGCLFRRGVAVQMTTNDGYGQDFLRSPKPALAGPFVAFTYYWEGSVEGVGYSVMVRDLRGHKYNLFDFEANDNGTPDKAIVKSLTVTPGGWVAWGWTLTYDGGRVVNEIRRLQPGQDDLGFKTKPLDSGPDVDPASLTRDGTSIFWNHGDEPRTAELG